MSRWHFSCSFPSVSLYFISLLLEPSHAASERLQAESVARGRGCLWLCMLLFFFLVLSWIINIWFKNPWAIHIFGKGCIRWAIPYFWRADICLLQIQPLGNILQVFCWGQGDCVSSVTNTVESPEWQCSQTKAKIVFFKFRLYSSFQTFPPSLLSFLFSKHISKPLPSVEICLCSGRTFAFSCFP